VITTIPIRTTATITAANKGVRTPATGAKIASTLSSAKPVASLGVYGRVRGWVSSFFEAIRGCLVKIPGVGSWFKKEKPIKPIVAPTPAQVTVPAHVRPDIERVTLITGYFLKTPQATPSDADVDQALELFVQIMSPLHRMEVLNFIAFCQGATPGITRDFCNALPADMLQALRHRILLKNRSDVYPAHSQPQQMGFGQHMINNYSRAMCVKEAIDDYLGELRAATPAAP
jgi:hypothetical protein